MTQNAIKVLKKKHLLIIGKSKKDRKAFVNKIIESTNFQMYRFPSGISSSDEYISNVDKLFPYKTIDYHKGKKWNFDQIYDMHLDWAMDSYGNLIILEEFQEMKNEWNIEFLRDYIQKIL